MPPLPTNERWAARLNWISFWLFGATMTAITVIFFLGDILMTGRLIFVGILAFYDRFRSHVYGTPEQIAAYRPKVAVLIPAYNEEKVIERTVQGALDSDYPNLRVIVIDDGSKDRTLEIVRRVFAREEAAGKVVILTKPNGGKAEALNYGLEHIGDAELFVGIDADTIIAPDAISRMVPHFLNPKVGGDRRQRQGRQPRQPLDALAGPRIHHQPEFRAPRSQHHGSRQRRPRRHRRMACLRRPRGRRAITPIPSPRTPISPWLCSATDTASNTKIWRSPSPKRPPTQMRSCVSASAGLSEFFRPSSSISMLSPAKALSAGSPFPTSLSSRFFYRWSRLSSTSCLSSVRSGISSSATYHPDSTDPASFQRLVLFFVVFLVIDFIASAIAFALERRQPEAREDGWLLSQVWLQRFAYRQVFSLVLFRTLKRAITGTSLRLGQTRPHRRREIHSGRPPGLRQGLVSCSAEVNVIRQHSFEGAASPAQKSFLQNRGSGA